MDVKNYKWRLNPVWHTCFIAVPIWQQKQWASKVNVVWRHGILLYSVRIELYQLSVAYLCHLFAQRSKGSASLGTRRKGEVWKGVSLPHFLSWHWKWNLEVSNCVGRKCWPWISLAIRWLFHDHGSPLSSDLPPPSTWHLRLIMAFSASTPFVWLCDLRRPTYTDHLRRPMFCRCWPTSVELLAKRTKTLWFKRRLKTHLFGLLDHSA